MPIYDQYADVYDASGQIAFSIKMIPYLDDLLQRHPPPGHSMLDLACGTGTVALGFAQQGWKVYGVDASSRMLAQARGKAEGTACLITLSQQDMRHFVLAHQVALVTCLYDSLNYMVTLSDLQQVIRQVAAVLLPGGVFMADMNTQESLEHVWGDKTLFVENDDLVLIMRSGYNRDTHRSTLHIVGFVRQEDGSYSRFDEHHTEVDYARAEVRAALEAAGLQVEGAYDCFSFDLVDERTRRIMWVARKRGD